MSHHQTQEQKMNSLSDLQKEARKLKADGKTYREISELLNIPKSTVCDWVTRKKENMAARTTRTAEQKAEIVKKVNELRASGSTTEDACKTVGVATSNYYAYEKQNPKIKSKPYLKDITPEKENGSEEMPTTSNLVCVIGDIKTIQSFVRGL